MELSLEHLPVELQSIILSNCSCKALKHLSRTCKYFKRKIEQGDWFWFLKAQKDFGHFYTIIPQGDDYLETYRHYKQNMENLTLSAVRRAKSTLSLDLLHTEPQINMPCELKKLMMYSASVNGMKDVIARLVECGLDWDVRLEQNYTVLINAGRRGHTELTEFLLDQNIDAQTVDVNAQNDYGYTALHWAAEENHISTVKTLLERGADIESRNKYLDTPLLKASKNGHFQMVKLLLDWNVNFDCQNQKGHTPLMYACHRNYKRIVKILLEKGADPYIKDRSGYTTFSRAASIEITNMLEDVHPEDVSSQ